MGRSRLMRRIVKASPAARWIRNSYQAKVGLVILIILVSSAIIFSRAENVPIYEALFISLILLFGESTDPVTSIGKVSVILTMITGLIFFALIIGEVSGYLIERIMRRGKVKVLKQYSGSGHVVICGISGKLEGILSELRSEDLEVLSPVVILSPNAGDLSFESDELRHKTFAIVGDPLEKDSLERVNLAEARAVLVLSTDESIKGDKKYRDAYVTLVYNTIYNFLSNNQKAASVKEPMNIVLEFLDEEMNLLPCARGEGNQPEVYTTVIPGTVRQLIVEPIYLENMPRYLFIQSVLERDVSTLVNELLSTNLSDTCEFYYHNVSGTLLGKTFNSIETALLGTGVTAIGVLRRSQAMADMAMSGYKDANRIELLLNPETELVLGKEDTLVLISYDEKEVTSAFANLAPGKFTAPKQATGQTNACQPLPFKKMVIINWNRNLIRDILTEMGKLCANMSNARNSQGKLEVVLINTQSSGSSELSEMMKHVSTSIGCPVDEVLSVRVMAMTGSLSLGLIKEAGITRESARDTRVLILSEGGSNEDSDLQTMHQLQMIENRVSDAVFTAVELVNSKSQHYFNNTRADVVVSIDSFAEHLIAQAVLKPYISLIFRNLLTFTDDTCEFYFRDVPMHLIGKSYNDIQKILVGHPIILIGHARPLQEKAIHPRYSVTLNPKAAGQYDGTGREPRILKSEKMRKGDRIILIARVPEIVDSVLAQLK